MPWDAVLQMTNEWKDKFSVEEKSKKYGNMRTQKDS